MEIRKYKEDDISAMIRIWNKVVEDGVAFPQEECLDEESGKKFFAEQSYCAVAEDNGSVVGLYILRTTSDDWAVYPMRAMQWMPNAGAGISEKSWFWTALHKPQSSGLTSCSSTPLWRTISMPDICMSGLDSYISARSRRLSG